MIRARYSLIKDLKFFIAQKFFSVFSQIYSQQKNLQAYKKLSQSKNKKESV